MSLIQEHLQSTESFLRAHARPPYPEGFLTIGEYTLQNGSPLEGSLSPLTPEEVAILQVAKGSLSFPKKNCFQNAQRLVLNDPTRTLLYNEGYALSTMGIPMHHGWVTLRGKVVEVTWDEPGLEYFGVPFPTDDLDLDDPYTTSQIEILTRIY